MLACRRRCTHVLISVTFTASVGLSAGCGSFENLRGDGYKDSENWGQELRKEREDGTPYGGVTTKAQQIERNLGVK